MENNKYYTPEEITTISLLCDEMIKMLPKMDIKELKENYKFMKDISLFNYKHLAYTEEELNNLTEKNKDEFIKYFTSGLNILKINCNNFDFISSFENYDKEYIDSLVNWKYEDENK